MKKTKIWTVTISALLIFLFLTSCSSQENGNSKYYTGNTDTETDTTTNIDIYTDTKTDTDAGTNTPVYEESEPVCQHKYGEWSVAKQPECETDGTRERICNKCGYRDIEIIKKLGHVYSNSSFTQIENGDNYIEYSVSDCSVCSFKHENNCKW